MEGKAQPGYLALADISGFTSYLANTELEHAQEILSELLELIVERLTPLMTLSKLEGDAVFVYAPEANIPPGETLLELVETTYAAFRDRTARMQRSTSCVCAACKAIPTLDLKFFVHYGTFILQRVAGQVEVVGSDVNLAHRLLKNHVCESTGWNAYALFTADCLGRLGLQPSEMHPLTETYEHLGDVLTFSMDLRQRYAALVEARRIFVSVEEAFAWHSAAIAAPPAVVWSWLHDLERREQVMKNVHWSAISRPQGRNGIGARNHCAHGKHGSVEEVIDWRPFDYWTIQTPIKVLVPLTLVTTFHFEAIPDGTQVTVTCRLDGALPEMVRRLITKKAILQGFAQPLDTLQRKFAVQPPAEAPPIVDEPVSQVQ